MKKKNINIFELNRYYASISLVQPLAGKLKYTRKNHVSLPNWNLSKYKTCCVRLKLHRHGMQFSVLLEILYWTLIFGMLRKIIQMLTEWDLNEFGPIFLPRFNPKIRRVMLCRFEAAPHFTYKLSHWCICYIWLWITSCVEHFAYQRK